MSWGVLIVLGVLVGAFYVVSKTLRRDVIQETEFALHYRDGVFVEQLPPGARWSLPFRDEITRIDKRAQINVLSGQEILTQDRIAVKISLTMTYAPTDPVKLMGQTLHPDMALDEAARLALREAVAALTLDALLEARSDLGDAIREALQDQADALGYTLSAVALRDIMLPNNLKRAYASVLEAQKDSERRLEQARGEQAVMRSLANAAKTLEKNPALVQARMLQALDAGGNTIHFGAGDMGGVGGADPEKAKAKD